MSMICGAVELGGTKCVVTVGHGGAVETSVEVRTGSPDQTLLALREALVRLAAGRALAAIGVASFGPIALKAERAGYGRMLATPKPGWTGVDVLGAFQGLADRAAITTDVTAAALAEAAMGAARGCADMVYVTIGTGVGFGVVAGGRAVTGMLHPEAGHQRVRRQTGDDFAGVCRFHGDCLEGLVSGPALAARAGRPAAEIEEGDPIWAAVADALAEALHAARLWLSPERIVIGGGVGANAPGLLPRIARRMGELDAGYLPDPPGGLEALLAKAALKHAGLCGALLIAENPGLLA